MIRKPIRTERQQARTATLKAERLLRKERTLDLIRLGFTQAQIGKQLGIHRSLVSRYSIELRREGRLPGPVLLGRRPRSAASQ